MSLSVIITQLNEKRSNNHELQTEKLKLLLQYSARHLNGDTFMFAYYDFLCVFHVFISPWGIEPECTPTHVDSFHWGDKTPYRQRLPFEG